MDSSGDGNGDDDNGNGNENRIGEGGREAKKCKKPQNSCRRRAGNGGDTSEKRRKCRKERVGSVATNPDNLESNKEAGGGAKDTQGSSKNCTSSRKSVSHTYTHTHTRRGGGHKVLRAQLRIVQVERVCPLCRA